MVEKFHLFLGANKPLPRSLIDALLPWVFAAAFVIGSVELQRHWGDAATALYIGNLVVLLGVWWCVAGGNKRCSGSADLLIDLIVFSQLVGGMILVRLGQQSAGTELLRELAFWAPLVCVWWAICYHGRPARLAATAVLLYGGLVWTGHQSLPDRFAHEFIIQGAMALGLVTLLLNAIARHPEHFGVTPEAFDEATRDDQTGAASRAYFEAELAHTSAVADRYKQPFALIAARIDGFEAIAPERRHDVLRDFAWLVIDRLRHADTLCRWQDERFFVTLPSTNLEAAREVAENLRRSVADARLGGIDGTTACFGVCEHQLGEDHMITLGLAEQALKRAQQEGRNRLAGVDGPN